MPASPARATNRPARLLVVGLQQGVKFSSAADEWKRIAGHRRLTIDGGRWPVVCHLQLVGFDGFIQLRRLSQRFDVEFLLQHAPALLILPQGGRALTRQRIQLHQLAVRGLMQRIDRDPAARVREGGFIVMLRRESAHQPIERADQLAAQLLGLKERPIVEVATVAQTESGQKILAIKIDRLRQWFNATRTHFAMGVTVGATLR